MGQHAILSVIWIVYSLLWVVVCAYCLYLTWQDKQAVLASPEDYDLLPLARVHLTAMWLNLAGQASFLIVVLVLALAFPQAERSSEARAIAGTVGVCTIQAATAVSFLYLTIKQRTTIILPQLPQVGPPSAEQATDVIKPDYLPRHIDPRL